MQTKISLAYQTTRQDFLLALSAVLAFATTSLGFWLLLAVFIYLAIILRRDASLANYVPPEVDPLEIPPRTYFMPMVDNDYGIMNWYFRKRRNQYFTWSFVFLNVIFCPVPKTPDRHGFRRLQIYHEFAHCGRGELLLFVLVSFAAFKMIQGSVLMAILHYNPGHLYYFHIILIVFGCCLIWIASRIMSRREHIADFLAYSRLGEQYLRFLKSRVEDFDVTVSGQGHSRFRKWLARLTTWHPSFQDRVDFLEAGDKPSRNETVTFILAALLTSVVAAQITQTMLLPRSGMLTAFSSGEPSYFLQPIGFVMHFVLVGCLSWLAARSRSGLRFSLWAILTFAYCFGPALAQHLFMKIEDIYLTDSTYHLWHFIYPWGSSAVWWIVAILMRIAPASKRIPTNFFASYMLVAYLLGLVSFIGAATLYEQGHLPWARFFELSPIIAAYIFIWTLISVILIGSAESIRRIIIWVISKIYSLRHPAS